MQVWHLTDGDKELERQQHGHESGGLQATTLQW